MRADIVIARAERADLDTLTALALRLWPSQDAGGLRSELAGVWKDGGVFFLARRGAEPVGFAQCQLRRDYVEGTGTSPVGYLEGIFVEPSCRRQGVARALAAACEDWCRGCGCREFASDCEIGNEQSRLFHLRAGFREAGRIICFVKPL